MYLVGMNTFQSYYNKEYPHYKLQYEELANKNSSYKGIIIGTSHATHAIQPSVLDKTGIQFYNFSLNGSNPEFYLNWYKELFNKHHSEVKYCIISVDNYFFKGDAWRMFEQDVAFFPKTTFRELMLDGNKEYDRKRLFFNYFPVFKYRTQLGASLQFRKGDSHFLVEKYDRGFIPFETPFKQKYFLREERKDNLITIKQKELFVELVDQFVNEGIDVLFVMPPEYDLSFKEYRSLQLFMQEMSIKYRVPFFDFNGALSSNALNSIENFSDKSHMNEQGSQVFSEVLAKEIQEYYTLRN